MAAVDDYFFFSPSMMETHLNGYDSEERFLIDKDLEVVKSVCFHNNEGSERPFYLATAGGPGARKSTILEKFLFAHPEFSNYVYLDPDQRCLKFMVHTYYSRSLCARAVSDFQDYSLARKAAYEKWRGASNYITLVLLEEAFAKRMNIVHGATSTGGHIHKLLQRIKEANYQIALVLCSCEDSTRKQAISYRNEKQCFYQSTPEDDVIKGRFFAQKMPYYFEWADVLYLYWSDDVFSPERLAAVFSDGQVAVCDPEAYRNFISKFERDRADLKKEGIELPDWNCIIDRFPG